MFLDFHVAERGSIINVYLRAFLTKFALLFLPLKTELVVCFWNFWTVEGGTPYKRVPEGFVNKVCVSIFTRSNRVRSMFLDFMDSRGEGEPLVNVCLRAFLTKFAF